MSAGPACELTVIGCSGSFPGPDSAGELLPRGGRRADGRTWRMLLDLGSGALGAAAAVRRPARRPRRACFSATSTPTTAWTCAASTCCASTTPAARSRASRSGDRRAAARTDGPRLRPARGPRHDPRVRLPASTRAPVRPRPFTGDAVPGRPPGPGLRPPGHRRRRARSPTPVTPGPCAGCRGGRARCRPAARRGVVPPRRGQPRQPPPHRRRVRRGRGPRRRAAGW